MSEPGGRYVQVDGTRLWVVGRGPADAVPLLVLHGGPGLDHHEFGDYLDPLTDTVRLELVDLRAQGLSDRSCPTSTWTLAQMAADVSALGAALGDGRYAVLGHSYGAFVALQHAVDAPDDAAASIISCGVPSMSWLEGVADALASFEPEPLRRQVADSWAREESVSTPEELAELMRDQMPFHFGDPTDPRIADYERRTAGTVYSPEILRAMAPDYGSLEVTDRLGTVTQPVLALAGRLDRTCPAEAAAVIGAGVRDGRSHVFEASGHMPFVEQTDDYLDIVRRFLREVL